MSPIGPIRVQPSVHSAKYRPDAALDLSYGGFALWT
jgi:hypothetical protein